MDLQYNKPAGGVTAIMMPPRRFRRCPLLRMQRKTNGRSLMKMNGTVFLIFWCEVACDGFGFEGCYRPALAVRNPEQRVHSAGCSFWPKMSS